MYIRQTILFCLGILLWSWISSPVQASSAYTDHEVVLQLNAAKQLIILQVENPDEAIATLRKIPTIRYVERNAKRYISAMPNDPEFAKQYYLNTVSSKKAWPISHGKKSIVVAVIDTGIDLDHPDLKNNIWTNAAEIADNGLDDDSNGYIDDGHGWDFVDGDANPNPTPTTSKWSKLVAVHGTHVAGIIGAQTNNRLGVSGINWQVSLMPLRAFGEDGSSTEALIYEAILYAVHNGATVINMSYGGFETSQFEEEAIQYAYDQGILSVAAAGNVSSNATDSGNLNNRPEYPVCYSNVIGVAATGTNNQRADFSNYGNTCVDVAAPGENIYSTFYTNDPEHYLTEAYGVLSGTSMSTPIVTGIIALVKATNPQLTPQTLTSLLQATADPLNDPELGSGLVNAYQAIVQAAPPKPVTTVYRNIYNHNTTIQPKKRTNATRPYITWRIANTINTITGYYVYWGTTPKDPVPDGQWQTQATFSPAPVQGNERHYFLTVRSVTSEGNYSQLTKFNYLVDTKTVRPIVHTLQLIDHRILLVWYAANDPHVTRYQIYRSSTGKKNFKRLATVPATQTSYFDTTIQLNHNYTYKLRTVDDLGNKSGFFRIKYSQP